MCKQSTSVCEKKNIVAMDYNVKTVVRRLVSSSR